MKMAERQNILAMGLDPDEVISFGGGWVNHAAPEGFRAGLPGDRRATRRSSTSSGGYTATLGDTRVPRAARALRGAPLRRAAARRASTSPSALGSTQLTHDLFRDAARSGRHRDAARSDLRELRRPARVCGAGRRGSSGCACSIRTTWALPAGDGSGRASRATSSAVRRAPPAAGALRRARQPDQPDPAAGAGRRDARAHADAGAWLAIDFAYKCQCFAAAAGRTTPGRRPIIPTSSASTRTRSGGAAWAAGSAGSRRRRRSSTRSSACSSAACSAPTRCRRWRWRGICRARSTTARCARYVDDANALYREAARVTHRRRRRAPAAAAADRRPAASTPSWTSAPTPTRSCREALKATGVLVVPGGGFGPSLANGVRISFGPLVMDHARITAGLRRLGAWMRG